MQGIRRGRRGSPSRGTRESRSGLRSHERSSRQAEAVSSLHTAASRTLQRSSRRSPTRGSTTTTTSSPGSLPSVHASRRATTHHRAASLGSTTTRWYSQPNQATAADRSSQFRCRTCVRGRAREGESGGRGCSDGEVSPLVKRRSGAKGRAKQRGSSGSFLSGRRAGRGESKGGRWSG